MEKLLLLYMGINLLFISTHSFAEQEAKVLESVSTEQLKFLIVKTGPETKAVCYSTGGYNCKEIPGSVTANNNMASFQLHHEKGETFNLSLGRFLQNQYESNFEMTCTQSSSCTPNDKSCSINLICRKP